MRRLPLASGLKYVRYLRSCQPRENDSDARGKKVESVSKCGSNIQIISEYGGHSNQLGRGRRGDGHEDDEQRSHSATFSEKGDGCVREDKPSGHVCLAHAVRVGGEARVRLEGERGQAHRRGRQPGDSKPRQAADDVARESVDGRGGDRLVVVAIVQEDGAEVADDVDDEEDGALAGLHRQVAPVLVPVDRVRRRGLDQEIVYCARRA